MQSEPLCLYARGAIPLPKMAALTITTTILLLLSICPASAQTSGTHPTQITVAIYSTGMPHAEQTASGSMFGIIPDMLAPVWRQLNTQAHYVAYPIPRLLPALAEQQADVVIMPETPYTTITNLPAGVTCITPPLLELTYGLFSKGENTPVSDPARVGLLHPGANEEVNQRMVASGHDHYSKHYLKSVGAMFKSLASNRLDYVISTDLAAKFWGAQLGTPFHSSYTFGSSIIYLCYRNRDEQANRALTDAYMNMLEHTNLDQVKAKYMVPNDEYIRFSGEEWR